LLVDSHDTEAATTAAQLAHAVGLPTVVDIEHVRPGTDALLSEIDVIVTAREFPESFTGKKGLGQALRELQNRHPAPIVCTTLGEDGSLALVGGVEFRTPGFAVDVVDTTGAGDVFRGGLIAGWSIGGDAVSVEDVLRYANAVAALKCRALGAREGIPTRREVDALLRGDRM
jgi:sugar/nucleoside kinase (ribokinase family)